MKNYNLEERTATFGKEVIELCRRIPQDTISRPIISQLVRSATSVGANYAEAIAASSTKDFVNKIYIARKEAQETKHWLRMASVISDDAAISRLSQECHELILIFQKTTLTLRGKIISDKSETWNL